MLSNKTRATRERGLIQQPSDQTVSLQKRITLLKRVPIFSALEPDELKGLGEVIQRRHYPAHTIILRADEEGETLYLIEQGIVKVTVGTESTQEVILSTLQEGDFFGEMSLLDGRPRSATVIAVVDVDVLLLEKKDFLSVLESHPTISLHMLTELARRLRRTDRQVGGLALLDVYGRIAGVLLQLAEDQGIMIESNLVITELPTHKQIAAMAGTSRETVTRVLNDLKRRGYILSDEKRMTILDYQNLKENLFQLGG